MSTPEFKPADHPRDPGGQFAIKIGEESGGTDVLGGKVDRKKAFGELVEQEEQVTRQLVRGAVAEISDEFRRVTDKDLRYIDLARNDAPSWLSNSMEIDQLTAADGTTYRWEGQPSDSNEDDFLAVTDATVEKAKVLHESRMPLLKDVTVSDDGYVARLDVSKIDV